MKLMQRTNADGMISTDGMASALLVQELASPGINDVLRQMISSRIGSHFYLHDTKLENRRFYDLQVGVLKHEKDLQVVGIIKGEMQILNPSKDVLIERGDKLIVVSQNEDDIEKIEAEVMLNG